MSGYRAIKVYVGIALAIIVAGVMLLPLLDPKWDRDAVPFRSRILADAKILITRDGHATRWIIDSPLPSQELIWQLKQDLAKYSPFWDGPTAEYESFGKVSLLIDVPPIAPKGGNSYRVNYESLSASQAIPSERGRRRIIVTRVEEVPPTFRERFSAWVKTVKLP